MDATMHLEMSNKKLALASTDAKTRTPNIYFKIFHI